MKKNKMGSGGDNSLGHRKRSLDGRIMVRITGGFMIMFKVWQVWSMIISHDEGKREG